MLTESSKAAWGGAVQDPFLDSSIYYHQLPPDDPYGILLNILCDIASSLSLLNSLFLSFSSILSLFLMRSVCVCVQASLCACVHARLRACNEPPACRVCVCVCVCVCAIVGVCVCVRV